MGYYLHLHGSLIFDVQQDNKIIKLNINREDFSENNVNEISINVGNNIVLANKEEKIDLIGNSDLLREYWKVFEKNIYHCKHLFLVGCGIDDDHIKEQIKKRLNYFKDKPLNIFVISRFYKNDELEKWKEFIDSTLSPSMETKVITHNEIGASVLTESDARVLIKMEESLLDFHWFQNT